MRGMELTRRQVLLGASSSVLLLAGCARSDPPASGRSSTLAPAPQGIAELLRGTPFYIAHRGSGDNWTEHTEQAYAQSVAAGVKAIEISVHATADGVLICHHDSNLRRLTGQDLDISEVPLSALEPLRNDARAWLGPAAELQPIPLLEDVLDAYAATHVIFIEDKQGTNAPALLSIMDRYPNSHEHFVLKQHAMDDQYAAAVERGYRIWGYFEEEDSDQIEKLAPGFDYLGVTHLASDEIVTRIVAQGKPVICWAVHTRAMRDRMLGLGVAGMMCSNIPYVTTDAARYTTDRFATGLRAAGDLPWTADRGWGVQPGIDPQTATVTFSGDGGSSYCMGSMCPVTGGDYHLGFQMRWPEALPGQTEHAGIAFGQANDSPYRVRVASEVGGYHLVVRSSGMLELFRREPGVSAGTLIGRVQTEAPEPGQWMALRVHVDRQSVTVERSDGAGWRAVAQDDAFRGGYFSLTKNYSNGPDVQFRSISVDHGPAEPARSGP
jgi:glycerophosphoryl diester phosphodiesterase